jgi:hypothetical protein
VLLDLDQLALIPKSVRPLEEQDEQESRRLWDPVTQVRLSERRAVPSLMIEPLVEELE